METLGMIFDILVNSLYIFILVCLPIITIASFIMWKRDSEKSITTPFAWCVITAITFAMPEEPLKYVLAFIIVMLLLCSPFMIIFSLIFIDDIRKTYKGNYTYLFIKDADITTLYAIEKIFRAELIEVYACSEITIFGDILVGYAFRCDNNIFKFAIIKIILKFVPGDTDVTYAEQNRMNMYIEMMKIIRSYS